MSITSRPGGPGRGRAVLLGMLAMLYAGQAAAAGQETEPGVARFSTFENDAWANTGRYYTNGTQFSIKRNTDARSPLAKTLTARACSFLGCQGTELLSTQVSFGQLMYTPSDIMVRDPRPLGRPWAGLLSVEQIYTLLSPDRRTLTTLATEVGVTGRTSLSEPSQKLVNRILDKSPSQGWDNQLGGALALMLSAERRTARGSLSADLGGHVRLNTATYYRLALGNLMNYAAAGVSVVVGKDLPLVSPSSPGIGNKPADGQSGDTSCLKPWLRCTAFGSVETRLMGDGAFLDGRVFQEDPSVKRRNWVADLKLGLRLDFPHSRTASHGPWFVQFKVTRRSPEFRSSIPVPRHTFAAVTVGTEF